jgi:hypothetical protein
MRLMILFVLCLPMVLATACASLQKESPFNVYTFSGPVSFTVEIPPDWEVTDDERSALFFPPVRGEGYIGMVVYNPLETPPLAVHVTYDTLRVLEAPIGRIAIMARDPASATERFMARVIMDNHVVEFQSHAEPVHDAVFDHMLASLQRIN